MIILRASAATAIVVGLHVALAPVAWAQRTPAEATQHAYEELANAIAQGKITRTPTPSPTLTLTPTATITATPLVMQTDTPTPTVSPVATSEPCWLLDDQRDVVFDQDGAPVPCPTNTPEDEPIEVPTDTPTLTPTPALTQTPVVVTVVVYQVQVVQMPAASAPASVDVPTLAPLPTLTDSPTSTVTPTASPTVTPTPSWTPHPTMTPRPVPTLWFESTPVPTAVSVKVAPVQRVAEAPKRAPRPPEPHAPPPAPFTWDRRAVVAVASVDPPTRWNMMHRWDELRWGYPEDLDDYDQDMAA